MGVRTPCAAKARVSGVDSKDPGKRFAEKFSKGSVTISAMMPPAREEDETDAIDGAGGGAGGGGETIGETMEVAGVDFAPGAVDDGVASDDGVGVAVIGANMLEMEVFDGGGGAGVGVAVIIALGPGSVANRVVSTSSCEGCPKDAPIKALSDRSLAMTMSLNRNTKRPSSLIVRSGKTKKIP